MYAMISCLLLCLVSSILCFLGVLFVRGFYFNLLKATYPLIAYQRESNRRAWQHLLKMRHFNFDGLHCSRAGPMVIATVTITIAVNKHWGKRSISWARQSRKGGKVSQVISDNRGTGVISGRSRVMRRMI